METSGFSESQDHHRFQDMEVNRDLGDSLLMSLLWERKHICLFLGAYFQRFCSPAGFLGSVLHCFKLILFLEL